MIFAEAGSIRPATHSTLPHINSGIFVMGCDTAYVHRFFTSIKVE